MQVAAHLFNIVNNVSISTPSEVNEWQAAFYAQCAYHSEGFLELILSITKLHVDRILKTNCLYLISHR